MLIASSCPPVGGVLVSRLRRRDVRVPGFVAVLEAADLPLGFFLADAVGFLHLARELIATALDHVELIVGELAPLLLHFPLELLPVSCDLIPVHCESLHEILRWADRPS